MTDGDDDDFDALLKQALDNAIEDRALTKDAYNKMKGVFEVDPQDPNTLQAAMFVGATTVKLLEQMSRANEQIVKLSQLRQKDKPKEDGKRRPISVEDLKEHQKRNLE